MFEYLNKSGVTRMREVGALEHTLWQKMIYKLRNLEVQEEKKIGQANKGSVSGEGERARQMVNTEWRNLGQESWQWK